MSRIGPPAVAGPVRDDAQANAITRMLELHGRVLMPEGSRLLVRKAASAFDAYLAEPGRQFSRAV